MPRQEFGRRKTFPGWMPMSYCPSTGAALEYIAGATQRLRVGRARSDWNGSSAWPMSPAAFFSRYLIEPWYILLLLVLDYPRSRFGVKLHGRAPAIYAGSDKQSSPIQMRGD